MPSFITAPGEADSLMVFVAIFLVLVLVGGGVLYLTLHSLPERVAHRRHRLQFEIVAVLGLIALFTHNNFFWVAALLLALIDLPDILSPMRRLADAAERMAPPPTEPPTEPPARDAGQRSEG